MRNPRGILALRAGSLIIVAASIVIMIFVGAVALPRPLFGEEERAGTTFSELQASNPGLADVVWHYHTAVSILAFATALLMVLLVWKGVSKGSPFAWYSVLFLTLMFLASLLVAHVPVRMSFAHWGPPFILTLIILAGLAVAAKPVLSMPRPALA